MQTLPCQLCQGRSAGWDPAKAKKQIIECNMVTNQGLHMRMPVADCLDIWYQPYLNFHKRALACDESISHVVTCCCHHGYEALDVICSECRAKHVSLLSMKRCIYLCRQAITCRQVSQSKTLSAVELSLNVGARSIPYLAICAAFECLVVFGTCKLW